MRAQNSGVSSLSNFLKSLRLWQQEPHRFTVWEKTAMALSAMTLIVGMILLPQNIALFNAKSALEKTGDAVDDFCSLAVPGLTPQVLEICTSLLENTKAVFDFTNGADKLPTCIIPVNASACITPKHIGGLYPFDWFVYALCEKRRDEYNNSFFGVRGHVFSGSPVDVQARQGMFPVVTEIQEIFIPVTKNITIGSMLTLFLLEFCTVIKDGGRGTLGHTDGFKRPAEDFGLYARIFGSIDGFMVIAAALLMLVLQLKKMIHKCVGAYDKYHANMFLPLGIGKRDEKEDADADAAYAVVNVN